jgi:phospholipid/cholesterol/gamma-HCH transport system substrate-binding protein
LLEDLQPATGRLTSVSRNLSPVLSDLRPAVAELRPALGAASDLLERTPELIDTAHAVLPPLRDTLTEYQPAVAFLRPYSPELAGWIANWSQAFAHYDSQGHVWSGLLAPGTNAVDEGLVAPPGSVNLTEPAPGEIAGQPWTDANGSGIR